MSVVKILTQKWAAGRCEKAPRGGQGVSLHAGTQLTCFTGTKVQILTLSAYTALRAAEQCPECQDEAPLSARGPPPTAGWPSAFRGEEQHRHQRP